MEPLPQEPAGSTAPATGGDAAAPQTSATAERSPRGSTSSRRADTETAGAPARAASPARSAPGGGGYDDEKCCDSASEGGVCCGSCAACGAHGCAASGPYAAPLSKAERASNGALMRSVWHDLSWLDRLLSLNIIVAMILGVVIGVYADTAPLERGGEIRGVSAPLVVGLLVMMWPILCKVQYEHFPDLFRSRALWRHIAICVFINWIIAPLLMLGLATATLPDLPSYRIGILLVGTARCIAMVLVWTSIARGDINVCAVMVIINSLLQIVLYAPLALLQINVISRLGRFDLDYGDVAIAVLIYLGIPLAAGVVTRFGMMALLGKKRFHSAFLPYFSPLSLAGLLYTIIIIFAQQARHVLHNLGPTFRTMVPLVLYFAIVWTATFALVHALARRYGPQKGFTYEMAATQAFTASGNNFELGLAVAVAVYGANSDQALAATIGPLIEIPVLLTLSWLSLFLAKRLSWDKREALKDEESEHAAASAAGKQDEAQDAEKRTAPLSCRTCA